MRRLRTATVLGAALLALGLVLSGGAAGGSGKGGKTIRLTGCDGAVRESIDLGAPGSSPGDLLVGRGELCQGQRNVGFVRFTCVFNIGTGVMCTNHITLTRRGQIVSQQSGDPAEGPVVIEAITGGTGEFRTARGEVRADLGADPVRLTIRIR